MFSESTVKIDTLTMLTVLFNSSWQSRYRIDILVYEVTLSFSFVPVTEQVASVRSVPCDEAHLLAISGENGL